MDKFFINKQNMKEKTWTYYNNQRCYDQSCRLEPTVGSKQRFYCRRHDTSHTCGWTECSEGTCKCKDRRHCYLGSMCPAVIDGNNLKCEMTGYILDQQPVYVSTMEQKEIEAGRVADPFCASEGMSDDQVYLYDKSLFQMLNASESVKTFEDIDLKLFFAIKEYSGNSLNRDMRYAMYKFLVHLFKTGASYTQFKKANNTQITRALVTAAWEHYRYRFPPEAKRPNWCHIHHYRKLNKLKKHMLDILKTVDPEPQVTNPVTKPTPASETIQAMELKSKKTENFPSEEDAAYNLGTNKVWIQQCLAGERDNVLSRYGKRYRFRRQQIGGLPGKDPLADWTPVLTKPPAREPLQANFPTSGSPTVGTDVDMQK